MPYKDPTTWPFGVWLLAVCMATMGGFVNWYGRAKMGFPASFNLLELIGEGITSGFVGVGVFMLAEGMEQNISICAALAGISGYMSIQLLHAVSQLIEAKLQSITIKVGKKK